jgi:hypothetical protein
LLIDEELARAIRTESAVALKYWWGIGTHAVWHWRRALKVNKVDNPGTHRLIVAAAEKAAEAMRAREWSPAEIEAKRAIAIKLNLGQYWELRSKEGDWTKEELAMLGTMPDEEIAKRIGRTTNAVRVQRTKRRIQRFKLRS